MAGALGIDDETLRKRMTRGSTLDAMFRARNLIVHELDLTNKSRTTRTIDDTERWVREALDVCQAMINTVARALPAPEETVFPWRRRRKKQQ